MIGSFIDNYKVVEKIGEGGMGVVYKAFDTKLERYSAIKILNSEATKNPHFIERFKREAKNQANLMHTNIVPVYDFKDKSNLFCIIMEYIEGKNLEKLIEENGPLNAVDALNIMKQILSGVGFAHKKGYIHRDLKPSNIILTKDIIAKILDFGISKSIYEDRGLTKTGVKIGTLLYMSPEQIKSLEPTPQTDVYTLGMILYEMLAGKNPFDSGSDFDVMEMHLKKYPPKITSIRTDVVPEVEKIIRKAIQKDPNRRYSSCEDFLTDVENALEQQEKVSSKKEIKPKLKKATNKVKFFSFAAAVILVLISLSWIVYNYASDIWSRSNNHVSEDNYLNNQYVSNPTYIANTGWKSVKLPFSGNINSITSAENHLYICGDSGIVLKSSDLGATWQNDFTPFDGNLNKIVYSNGRLFAVGKAGLFITKGFSDSTWLRINTGTNETLFDIHFVKGTSKAVITGNKGLILLSGDYAATWSKVSTQTTSLLYSAYFINSETGFAAGWYGDILKTIDGGKSWEQINKLTTQYLRKIYFATPEFGIFTGGGGEIIITRDGGKNFEVLNSGTSSGIYSAVFYNPFEGLAITSRGEVLYTNTAGKTWNVSDTGRNLILTDIILFKNKVFITGYNGTLLIK